MKQGGFDMPPMLPKYCLCASKCIPNTNVVPCGVCSCTCGGTDLYQRSDDVESVCRSRLVTYHQETEPVLDFYRPFGLLKDYNIQGGVKETLPDLLKFVQGNMFPDNPCQS